jgi:DNA-binding response OmpR family regulator
MNPQQPTTKRANGNLGERKGVEPRVLVVDDEENLVTLVAMILGKQGYAVKTALNCEHALKLLEQDFFDLAILDIKMFPVDGIMLLGEIRKRYPFIKVIMVTAYPTTDGRNECLKKGASLYLSKPLDIQELKNTVRTLLTQ